MSSQSNNESDRPSHHNRRGSIVPGSSLSDFLSSTRGPTTAYPGPITAAAHQRRMSMSSASGSPPRIQTGFSMRRGSVSSISSTHDESAIDDSEPASGSPSSAFARRLSWGARALREVRLPMASRVPQSPTASSPTISRGFWLDSSKTSNNEPPVQQRRPSMPAPPVNAIPPKDKSYDPLEERMLRNDFYLD